MSVEKSNAIRERTEAVSNWNKAGMVGAIRMSEAAFRSAPKDYRNSSGGRHFLMVLAASGHTVVVPVEFIEEPDTFAWMGATYRRVSPGHLELVR